MTSENIIETIEDLDLQKQGFASFLGFNVERISQFMIYGTLSKFKPEFNQFLKLNKKEIKALKKSLK